MSGAPPGRSYREVATAGTERVATLAGLGRWDEAVDAARELKAIFAGTPDELGPIAHEAFDGLLAASLARDEDEVGDFVALVRELFP